MPVTRSEKRLRASSEQSELPSNNLSQTSELELSNSTSRPNKRSKRLPPSSDISPNNGNTVAPGPKSDTAFTAPQEELRRRSRRSCVTSSKTLDVSHTPEIGPGKSTSRSEKRAEQRRLKKLQSRSEVPSSDNSTVASALKSGLGSYSLLEEPRMRSLRPRSSMSSSNTPTPAPTLDMRSYNSQETGLEKFRYASYESSASRIDLPDRLEEMIYVPEWEVGERKNPSHPTRPSTKRANRSPSPTSDMRFNPAQQDSLRPKKKARFFESATGNDDQIIESSAGSASSRLKLNFKRPASGPKLSEGNSAPSYNGIPTPASEDLSSPLSENLSSLLSSNSAPSPEGNTTSCSKDKDSPLSTSNSASYSENSVAPLQMRDSVPYSEPQSKKRAAARAYNSPDGAPSVPRSNLNNTPQKTAFGDATTTDGLFPEKQGQYRAERDKEPPRVADQQKVLATMEDFRKGFKDLLTHIRAPRKNSHSKKNPNEHMFALKLSPQLCLMAPSQRHSGIYMKDTCFDSTSEAMVTWVMGYLMEVVKGDGLAWGEIATDLTEGGWLGKVSNWGFNLGCSHQLETCFINTNVEILLCRKSFSAIITYHHQWKCAGQYEFPSGDMTDVYQAPRQSRTDHTTTGGGSSFSTGAGDSGYGSVLHTPVAGPSFSHAAAPAFAPSADMYAVEGHHMPSCSDYIPANPCLSPYPAPAPPPLQPAYGNFVDANNSDLDRILFGPALLDPALPTPPLYGHDQFAPPAFDTPPHHPGFEPLFPPYQWVQPPTPSYLNPWITPADLPSPAQEQFTYPDPDIATDSYVANWVGASLNLPLEPERGCVFALPPPPPVAAPAAGPKKGVRKSRAKGKGAAAGAAASAPAPPTPTPTTAPPMAAMQMQMMMAPVPAPEPVVFDPSPSQTLAALQSAASSSPGVPVPAAYRHVWFLNGRGRVSKTRDNNPRCQRCRRRHWASCSRGQPCDECAKDNEPCVYGPGVGGE